MEAAVWHANFFLIVLLFCPLRDGQAMKDPCQEEAINKCLENKVKRVFGAILTSDLHEAYKVTCTGKKTQCTELHAGPDCPAVKKLDLQAGDALLTSALNALCQNRGIILKKLVKCWDMEAFATCMGRVQLPDMNGRDSTRKSLELLKIEVPNCLADSKQSGAECTKADFKQVRQSIDDFLEDVAQADNDDSNSSAATQAGTSVAALLSVSLALAFTA
ncbi:uncharacterized protein LOC119386702 [Rhipicephalus sanguineus]|uniref:uncharacterized protein LOC119386702 n=1 Tax=Rhipicephalus sanguineus TaxID=34632 RepID=UPI0018962C10|nr:uncharacterized protein LOC119386702 [Rhipicephalus sanguineus]